MVTKSEKRLSKDVKSERRKDKSNKICKGMLMNLLKTLYFLLHSYVDMFIDYLLALYWDGYRQSLPNLEKKHAILMESAVKLAEKIRKKELKSEELVTACIERIKQVNPILNAVVDERYEEALKEAREVDKLIETGVSDDEFKKKPFLGVPFTAKESHAVSGMLHTLGVRARRSVRADADAECVRLVRAAGAIPVAVTNVPEINKWMETRNMVYGQTNNPYDSGRTVGGSSGGEAALHAALGSPISLCSDIGGSTRMPAFFCGLFGYNPTAGHTSLKGSSLRSGKDPTMASVGFVSKHCEDLAPLTKIVAAEKAQLLNLDRHVDIKDIKFFYVEDVKDLRITPVCSELRNAMKKAISTISKVVPSEHGPKPYSHHGLQHCFQVWKHAMSHETEDFANMLTNNQGRASGLLELGKKVVGQSQYTLAAILKLLDDQVLPAVPAAWADQLTDSLRDDLTAVLGDSGVLLFPSGPSPARPHYALYTSPFNFSLWGVFNALQLPAVQIPLGVSSRGLPLGVQAVAGPRQDALVLAVAEHLRGALGGFVPPCRVPETAHTAEGMETRNMVYGQTNNPYDSGRTVGGSSGGEAALHAALGSPISLCSDIGGSTRMPAFFCGLFGYNPTAGHTSLKGSSLRSGKDPTMASVGFVSKHCEDLAPLTKIVAAEKAQLLNLDRHVDIKDIKFFYVEDVKDLRITPVCSELRNAMKKAISTISKVVPSEHGPKPYSHHGLQHCFQVWKHAMSHETEDFANMLTNNQGRASGLLELGKKVVGQSQYTLAAILKLLDDQVLPAVPAAWADQLTDSLRDDLTAVLGDSGVLLFPSGPSPARPHYALYTSPFNFSLWGVFNALQLPAVQIPLGVSSRGLPLGVQAVAGPRQDALVLAVAEHLRGALGGFVPPCRVPETAHTAEGTRRRRPLPSPHYSVPFTAKESHAVSGMLHTLGVRARRSVRADADAECVRLVRAAGAIPVAVTNVPEINKWMETRNMVYGQTNNPYDSGRTVGGSSGGEAALHAALGSPISLCSDIGGSTRMPAFFCGLFGYNPTAGHTSLKGSNLRSGKDPTMASVGFVSKHCEDLAPLTKIVAAEKAQLLNLDRHVDIKDIKFFYVEDVKDLRITPVCSELRNAMKKAISTISKVVPSEHGPKPYSHHGLQHCFQVWKHAMSHETEDFANMLTNNQGRASGLLELGKKVVGQSQYTLAAILKLLDDQVLPAVPAAWADQLTDSLRDDLTAVLGDSGVLLFPSGPSPARPHYALYTSPFNFSLWGVFNALQLPAVQIPLGVSSRGLPLGVQAVAGPRQDALVLAVAEHLRGALGGFVPPCRVPETAHTAEG